MSNQETLEKEIGLKDLLFYCLKKWRCIVITMLIIAVLAAGYRYTSTIKSNQSKQEQEAMEEAENGEATETGIIANPNLEYYETAIKNSEESLEKQREYIDESVMMRLDAYHLQTGTLSFYLNGEVGYLDSLYAAYKAYVTDGRLAEDLAAADENISLIDLRALISFVESDRQSYMLADNIITRPEQMIFQVQITAPDSELCIQYIEKAEDALKGYGSQLQQDISRHELQLLAAVQSERADTNILTYQTDTLNAYKETVKSLQTLKADLENIRSTEGDTIEVGKTIILDNPVSQAAKFGILGLILGGFLSAFILILSYLLGDKLQSIDSFQREFGMRILGQVHNSAKKKRIFGFLDDWIYRLEEGAYANIPYDEQLKIVGANLKVVLSKEDGIKKIMVTGTLAEKDVSEVYEQLTSVFQEIAFSPYEQIVFSASALEQLDTYDGVLFLEKKGVSYSKLIRREKEIAVNRNVKVLGAVVL